MQVSQRTFPNLFSTLTASGHAEYAFLHVQNQTSESAAGLRPFKDLAIDLNVMTERVGARTRMIFICSPNNPTGTVIRRKEFDAFLSRLPDHVVVVVDEAYFEFVRDDSCPSGMDYLNATPAVVTLRTFSKA
jgi:histidinol-phosphate/aromatic aminotransferase/cobyric acid decarboxylase-like protein